MMGRKNPDPPTWRPEPPNAPPQKSSGLPSKAQFRTVVDDWYGDYWRDIEDHGVTQEYTDDLLRRITKQLETVQRWQHES